MKEAVTPTWIKPDCCQGPKKARRNDEVSGCGFHRGPDIKNMSFKEVEYMTATVFLSKFTNFSLANWAGPYMTLSTLLIVVVWM